MNIIYLQMVELNEIKLHEYVQDLFNFKVKN